MVTATNLQQAAHHTIPQLLRALAQQKWALAYADEMQLKASLITTKVEIKTLVTDAHNCLPSAYISNEKNVPIYKVMDKVAILTDKDIVAQLAAFTSQNQQNLHAPIEQLRLAPTVNKRAVLRSIPIINIPVAAAYLGTTAAALHQFTSDHVNVIGASYAGGYCLSIDEVFMIEQHLHWLEGNARPGHSRCALQPDATVFDHFLYVDELVASFYTDVGMLEIRKGTSESAHVRRPYRLFDLEKIRVAKLNAAA
jgi:hypothetical protein